ncbi:hypothetical protein F5Y18DRAFT_433920 [Xylariaceae sp. FL1019]|nr:hypothetical protein F5Y18DRAFT_433920 [Xylariaceae sp. FL1019]
MNELDDKRTSNTKGTNRTDRFFKRLAHPPKWHDIGHIRFHGPQQSTHTVTKKTTQSWRNPISVTRGENQIHNQLKNCVVEHISHLNSKSQHIPEFQGLLRIIENYMFVVNTEMRASSMGIVAALQNLISVDGALVSDT